MNKYLKFINLFIAILLISSVSRAQTPSDAIMMEKGQICWAALYTNESWDEYWEGTLKRDNGNIGKLTRTTLMPMFALGLSDKLNLIAMLPWVHTESSQGQLKGVSGFQDLGLFLKANVLDVAAGPGHLTAFPSVGFTVPTSNYLEDYAPYSLGLGCPDLSLRGIAQYKFDMGVYFRATGAYQVRGNAKIERDYYYTTHGVYSDKVDMPNAFNYGLTLGAWLLGNTLKIEGNFDGLTTYGGFDIRRQDAGFPSNKMEFTRIGAGLQYFLPFATGLAVVGGYNHILTGRNVGQSTAFTAGFTYQYMMFGNKSAEPQMN
jgi:hypothetical protein